MTLHLRKLAVGVSDVADFERRVVSRVRRQRELGETPEMRHVTRHAPKRSAELLEGGSLYWIVSGYMLVRTRLIRIEDVLTDEGKRCALVLEPALIRTEPRPHRPFQGWRYMEAADAPPDLGRAGDRELPAEMAEELRLLGLL